MKTSLVVITAVFFFVACKREKIDEPITNQINDTIDTSIIYYDSICYNIDVYTIGENITQVKKYENNILKEEIIIDYGDSVTVRRCIRDNVLVEKNYFYNNNKYAAYSIDSQYVNSHYFETYYKQDSLGYLSEETFSPGPDYSLKKVEYRTWNFNTNIADNGISIYPDLSKTSGPHYIYSDIIMEFDIINYQNNIKGKMNLNLPNKYGRQYFGRAMFFEEEIRYEYKLLGNRVIERIDYLIAGDTIKTKVINKYTYN